MTKLYDSTLPYKGYARIFVTDIRDIPDVKKIIRKMDPGEFDGYFPNDFITTIDHYPDCVYVGKFDMDAEALTVRCMDNGIGVFVLCAGSRTEDGMTPIIPDKREPTWYEEHPEE